MFSDRTPELKIVHQKYIETPKNDQKNAFSEQKTPVIDGNGNSSLSVYEIINKASRAKNGNKFTQLMSGNVSGYNSQSEADLALCNIIAFYTQDPTTVDAVYRQSKLMREKWDEQRGEDGTYGQITINRAIQDCRAAYVTPRTKKDSTPPETPWMHTKPDQTTVAADQTEGKNDWKKGLKKDKGGAVYSTISNILTILQNDNLLAGKIVLNQLLNQMEVCGKLPWGKSSGEFNDTDFNELLYFLEVNYNLSARGKTESALDIATSRAGYHPIRQYINKLKWDGKKRVDTCLIDYLGAEDSKYVRAVTRKTLVAAVARIYKPGCKFDNMLVMVGDQDLGKSTFFRKIAGDDWFSDSLKMTDMQGKSGPEKLSGKWILENAELAGARKAEVEDIKSFLSCQSDRYRAAYGRYAKDYPRQCIIVGSTNVKDGFLRDQTGNRRFWPVKVSDYRLRTPWEINDEVRDQLWAEAKRLYDTGEPLYLPRDLDDMAKAVQEEFTEENPYFGPIQSYLECKNSTCGLELWIHALGGEKSKYSRVQQLDIVACLAKMPGWQRGERERREGYGLQRIWLRSCDGK